MDVIGRGILMVMTSWCVEVDWVDEVVSYQLCILSGGGWWNSISYYDMYRIAAMTVVGGPLSEQFTGEDAEVWIAMSLTLGANDPSRGSTTTTVGKFGGNGSG